MDKWSYLNALQRESSDLVTAARLGLDAPVPSCPGWSVATLVAHLGQIYVTVAKRVSLGHANYVPAAELDAHVDPDFQAWFEQGAVDLATMPAGLLDWFQSAHMEVDAALRAADPEAPAWSWSMQKTAGFWQRRLAQETAVHRWDAQLAHDRTEPIEAALARDGIDEVMDVILLLRWKQASTQARGESYHFHATDGPGEWLLRFEPDGPRVSREHSRADVAVRGTASDLLLFLWHRIPAERLDVHGDAKVLDRLFELIPPA